MSQTISEKILSNKSKREVFAGDFVVADIDLAMILFWRNNVCHEESKICQKLNYSNSINCYSRRDLLIMDIYSVLSHPFRRKILFLLEKEGFIPYTDLMDKLGLETTGQLNFHLKKLGSLISHVDPNMFCSASSIIRLRCSLIVEFPV